MTEFGTVSPKALVVFKFTDCGDSGGLALCLQRHRSRCTLGSPRRACSLIGFFGHDGSLAASSIFIASAPTRRPCKWGVSWWWWSTQLAPPYSVFATVRRCRARFRQTMVRSVRWPSSILPASNCIVPCAPACRWRRQFGQSAMTNAG
jgi:hypothetical protein